MRIIFNNSNLCDGEITPNTSNHTSDNDLKQQPQYKNTNEEFKLKSISFLHRWNESEPTMRPHCKGTIFTQKQIIAVMEILSRASGLCTPPMMLRC